MKGVKPLRVLDVAILVLAVAMSLYHLVYTQVLLQRSIEHQDTHLLFGLLIVFLGILRKDTKRWPWILPLILLSVVATGYVKVFYNELELRVGIPTTTDIVIGIILVIITFVASWLSFGKILPIIGLVFMGYVFLGQYLPRPLWHFPISLDAAISQYNMGFSGMFGLALSVSANYIFLFILFGALLGASGATQFFMEVGRLAGKRLAGGAAMMSVVSSALVGTVTGSGQANVAITGPFTIPLMKQAGYKPEQAAAIEAVASSGGAIMPPVLGVAAFVMAEFMGVSYAKVAAMAIIPALLYYLCVGLFVQLNALKLRVSPLPGEANRRSMLLSAPLFFIPLVVLTALLMQGRSLMFTVFWAVVSLVALSLIRKETRGSLRTWGQGCVEGAVVGARIAVSCGVVGVITASVNLTGIGVTIATTLSALSSGNVLIALGLVALIVIVMGCGVPPFISYILAAMLCIPTLTTMGIPLISAHFFVFFLAVFALITPPVALAAVVAAPIAGADYIKTSFEAVKAGIVAWFLPFLAIFAPIVILQPQEPLQAATTLIASLATILMLQVFLVGYYFTKLNLGGRAIGGMSAATLIVFVAIKSYPFLAIGLALCLLLTIWELRKRRLLKSVSRASDFQTL